MKLTQSLVRLIEKLGYEIGRDSISNSLVIRRPLRLGRDFIADCRVIHNGELSCIFDVGAHMGETAHVFVNAFPEATIYSFEPTPSSFGRLSAFARRYPRVRTIHAALGDRDGDAPFFLNKYSQTNSLLPSASGAQKFLVEPDQMDLQSTTTVPMLTLNRFCVERGIEKIDLLKMDTQGAELKVLAGAESFMRRSMIPLIYAEVCFEAYYAGQPLFQHVYEYLYECEYRLVGLYESGFRTHYYRVGGNALFVHQSIARRAIIAPIC